MPHEHDLLDALPKTMWHSYGILQSYQQRSLRSFYDEVVTLIERSGGTIRSSYGLRFCHNNFPSVLPDYDIDRRTVPWKRLFPVDIDYIYSGNEFLITPDDIGTHPAFERGVLSFQVDFAEGFMGQFDVSFSNPSKSSDVRVQKRYLLKSPPDLLELRGVTDISLRLDELTRSTLTKACAYYHFWKTAAVFLSADLCCGGSYLEDDVMVCQWLGIAAFQFASGLPSWGTRPFEERRMPWKVELEKTSRATVWFDKCEDNPNIPHPWLGQDGHRGTPKSEREGGQTE
jgi:hypothetical protein